MIKLIYFDLFNTLIFEKREEPKFWQVAKLLNRSYKDYNFLKLYEKVFMTTPFADFREAALLFLKKLHIVPNNMLLDRLLALLEDNSPERFEMFEDAKQALPLLSKKYLLGIISNVSAPVYSVLRKKFNLENRFAPIIVSFNVGAVKPDKRIFLDAVVKSGVTRDHIIFVGDSYRDDIRAAENAGLNAVLIDRKKQHPEYENRITKLQEITKFLT